MVACVNLRYTYGMVALFRCVEVIPGHYRLGKGSNWQEDTMTLNHTSHDEESGSRYPERW